jgi:phosphate transport system protein
VAITVPGERGGVATGGIGLGADPPRRARLGQRLDAAEAAVLEELRGVCELLGESMRAATTGDRALAEGLAARASELERRYTEIHDQLMQVLALQAPVASDLRLAMALVHINDRVARMRAQCINIATLCCAMPADARASADQLGCLAEMARLVSEQTTRAAQILEARDVAAMGALRENDQQVNRHNRRCFELGVHDGTSETRRVAAFFVALMARALERLGDNAVDIAEHTAFVVTGRLR